MSYLYIFRERALYIVALLRKMTCNLRHPMPLRHPVTVELTFEHIHQGQRCLCYEHSKLSLCSASYLITIKGYFRVVFSKKTCKIELFCYALNSAPYLIIIKGYFRALFSKKTCKIELFCYALNSAPYLITIKDYFRALSHTTHNSFVL